MSSRLFETLPLVVPGVAGGPGLVGNWWLRDGEPFGMHLHHPFPEMAAGRWPGCAGGGYVAWRDPGDVGPLVVRHQLVSGGPEDLENLELAPSLWHRARAGGGNSSDRGCHGFLRGGRWHVV